MAMINLFFFFFFFFGTVRHGNLAKYFLPKRGHILGLKAYAHQSSP